MTQQRLLVTGATGKVGQQLLSKIFYEDKFDDFIVRALCHKRMLPTHSRLEVVKGSISNRKDVHAALQGVTHVLHLATCKETPDEIMDVAVKGMFWLLEECRISPSFKQFILIGGDAGMGHFFYKFPVPITEQQKHSAYPGCYALSKVLEETLLEQSYIQYGLNGCCLRAPWIMEKDDFKCTLSFGDDIFGGPRWRDLVGDEKADEYQAKKTIPVLCDSTGEAIYRNFVHIDDLIASIFRAIDNPKAKQQTFNICMDVPVNYRAIANFLYISKNLPSVDIVTEFESTWLDNAKAKFLLGWRPRYNLVDLIKSSWEYEREPDDPRKVWYPG